MGLPEIRANPTTRRVRGASFVDSMARQLGLGLENKWRGRTLHPRALLQRPVTFVLHGSAPRINSVLTGLPNRKRYLEVGIAAGHTLESVDADERWGVDPQPRFDLRRLPPGLHVFSGTSDDYFQQLADEEMFDFVFIDGLHIFGQALRDLVNALAHLRQGALLIDDVVPCDEISAIPDMTTSYARRTELGMPGAPWHGDVWKVVLALDHHFPELDFRTIVGGGNPQTLVWRKDHGSKSRMPDQEVIAELEAVSFAETFRQGVPSIFRPARERDAVRACLEGVTGCNAL